MLLVGLLGVVAARAITTPPLHVSGPTHKTPLNLHALGRLAFSAPGNAVTLRHERWLLDGLDVTSRVRAHAGELVFRPLELLGQGNHELVVTRSGGFLGAEARQEIPFAVDVTAPVELAHGQFSSTVPPPFGAPIVIVATDEAGNRTVKNVTVFVVPRRPPIAVRAVHVSAYAWADPTLRAGIMALINQHRINAVELDLKDESGLVGFDPPIALARKIGAAKPIYDLPAAVRTLHRLGVRVIGRLVAFRDPIAATAAWKSGRRNEVVQAPDGTEYSGYGGFSNFANPAVRRYEISIAVAAARDGVDDVLYDYVRRPDGPITKMVFPGLRGTPTQAIVEFLRETRVALQPYGTYLGASVFGIAATRPDQVAQNVPEIARQVDYVAPMVYPSHWNSGEYGVADPNAEPYRIVLRSLKDFKRELVGTGARLVPWLQDFSLGVTYGPKQVREQIAAERALGVRDFLLWNPDAVYTPGGLDQNARTSQSGLSGR